MDLREHPHAGERRHPWEVARRRFFLDALRDANAFAGVRHVLDVGSGDGWLADGVLDACSPEAHLTLWDMNYDDAWIARSDARRTYTRTAPSEPADLVLALDVAEHVLDDAAFLADVVSHLAPDGTLLFSVPTWQPLFSSHDVALGHFRRYAPREARALLEGAGLTVRRGGGLFHALLAPRVAQVALERVRPPREAAATSLAWGGGALLSAAVDTALRLDTLVSRAAASRALELPGLSWWALCHRSR